MKNNLLSACGFVIVGFSMTASAASNNTISFQGEVATQTCSVTVNSDSAPVVLLPTVSTKDLSARGDVAGATTFELALSDCTAATSATNVNAVFSGNLVDTANSGTLSNTGTATNVNLQLVDTANTPIDLSSTWTSTRNELAIASGETSSSATYTVRYYATGAATAGTVAGSVEYAVSYL